MIDLNDDYVRSVGERFRKARDNIVQLAKKYGGYSKIPLDCAEAKEYLQASDEYDRVKKMIDNIRGPDPHAAKLEAFRLYDILDGEE